MGRQIGERKHVLITGRVDRWMDGWMDGWVDGWMDGWMGRGTDECMIG